MQPGEIFQELRKRREMLGITQPHLAELSGLGVRTVKALENGSGNPTYQTISRIAEVLGMQITLQIKK